MPVAPFSPDSAKKVEEELKPSKGELAAALSKEARSLVRRLLQCASAGAFVQEREKIFGEYAALNYALSQIASNDLKPMVHQEVVQAVLASYETAVRAQGENLFGMTLNRRFSFPSLHCSAHIG